MGIRLAPLSDLLPDVLPLVWSCPRGIALDALRQTAMEFCRRSELWRDTLEGEIDHDEGTAEITPSDRGSAIARIIALRLNDSGVNLFSDAYSLEAGNIVKFLFTPGSDATSCTADVVLRPGMLSEKIPDFIMEEWGKILASGTLAKLKSMTGPKIEWSDLQGAAIQQQAFVEGTASARINSIRAGIGGKSMSVFDARERWL